MGTTYEDDSNHHGAEVPAPVPEQLPEVDHTSEEEEDATEHAHDDRGGVSIDDNCRVPYGFM